MNPDIRAHIELPTAVSQESHGGGIWKSLGHLVWYQGQYVNTHHWCRQSLCSGFRWRDSPASGILAIGTAAIFELKVRNFCLSKWKSHVFQTGRFIRWSWVFLRNRVCIGRSLRVSRKSEYFMGYTTSPEPTKYTVPLSDPGMIWDLGGNDNTPLWVSLW